jgi:nicotinamidase-related amidase
MMTLKINSIPFLDYLDQWQAQLPAKSLSAAIPKPDQTAIISVDMINGFCYQGPLSSPRVAGLVGPITALMQAAWKTGVHHILLTQDTHDPEAVEFAQWPAHCVRGTAEAETIAEIKALPFFDQMRVIPKNSIQSALNTSLESWLIDHPGIDTFIIVGDCTDLCVYQLAMYLRLDANARQGSRRVVLPADCVQTYDLPVDAALAAGIMPHPGDLTHALFLYHMALNGIEVIKTLGDAL